MRHAAAAPRCLIFDCITLPAPDMVLRYYAAAAICLCAFSLRFLLAISLLYALRHFADAFSAAIFA